MKDKSVTKIIQEVCEDICDNYCKYRDTVDEDQNCVIMREKGACPLDKMYWAGNSAGCMERR